RDADHVELRPVAVGRARLRHDRALEAQALGLLEAGGEALDAAELASKAELAEEHRARGRRTVAERGRDGHGPAEIPRRLAGPQPADEVHVHVVRSAAQAGRLP